MAASDRVAFHCDGAPVDVTVAAGRRRCSTVLREELGIRSVKDGCAPQGQCGCCTVLVDGAPRVACVTPAGPRRRSLGHHGRRARPDVRDRLVGRVRRDRWIAVRVLHAGHRRAGGVRSSSAVASTRADVDRALAAHLCRCTGWNTVRDAIDAADGSMAEPRRARDLDAASRRATLEGGVDQRVALDVPLGAGGFADDMAPDGCAVAVLVATGRGGRRSRRRRRGRPAVGRRRLAGRGTGACGQGPGAADDARRAGRRSTLPPLPVGRRAPRHLVGRARVPRARRVVVRARRLSRRHRSRTAARSGASSARSRRTRPRRARRPPRAPGPCACCPARTCVRLGPKRPPIAAAARARRFRRAHRRFGRRRRRAGAVLGRCHTPSRSTRPGSASTVAGPATSPQLRAWPLAELHRARRGCARRRRRRTRATSCATTAPAPCSSTPARSTIETAPSPVPASPSAVADESSASRCASPPVTRSTTSCCAPTASVPRTWRSGGCERRSSRSIPRPATCSTSRSVPSGSVRGPGHPADRRHDRRRPAPGAARARVRRGVRRRRRRDVERGHLRHGSRPESFPLRSMMRLSP